MQLHTLKRAGTIGLEDQGVMHQHQFNHSALRDLNNPEILIGVSSCLLGKDERFDNQLSTNNAMIRLLAKHFVIRSFSPEAEIDLGVAKENCFNFRIRRVRFGVLIYQKLRPLKLTPVSNCQFNSMICIQDYLVMCSEQVLLRMLVRSLITSMLWMSIMLFMRATVDWIFHRSR